MIIVSFAFVAVALLLIAGKAMTDKSVTSNDSHKFSLKPPPFTQSAFAQETPEDVQEIGDRLDNEAGIAAYYQAPGTIDLSLVRGQFRTIETETSDYIIGSIAVPGHTEQFDVHAYVHTSGWILAYYMNNEPTGKIINPTGQTINTTNFTTVISILAGSAGQPFTGETYYDFRYPNATNLLFVAENEENGRDFIITLPSAYGYSERSWAAYDTQDEVDFYLEDTNLWNSATWTSDLTAYGYITAAQLLPDTPHTFLVEDNGDNVYAVLVITYRVP